MNAYTVATAVIIAAYIILTILIGLFIEMVSDLVSFGYERSDFETIECMVSYGDTAWDIADRYCPSDMDKRLYLEWCAKENGMNGLMGELYYGRSYVFLELK